MNDFDCLPEWERTLLSDCGINCCQPEYPVLLTVFTKYGTAVVENINESSIRFADGTLTCEAQDNSSSCPLYTFGSVQGYTSTFQR